MENIFLLDPEDATHLDLFTTAMTDVHIDCVMNDHTMATFLPPLSREKIIEHYRQKAAETISGKYSVILEWTPISSHEAPPQDTVLWQGREMTGFVMLNRTPSETGPFRAFVEKLLVSPRHRKKGVARRVMARLEEEAVRTQSWLLMLDTVIGSGADHVYPKLGYTTMGTIPKYGFSPKDRSLVDEIFFYKDLRTAERLQLS